MATVFVTGGSGFLGRNLLPHLRERGHAVKALARSDAAARAVSDSGAEPVRGDLDDPSLLVDALRGCDAVIHAAAKVEDWGRWEDFVRLNVDGTKSLLEAARAGGVRRFVHVSTESVLLDGNPLRGVDESHPRPAKTMGMYGRSKALAEEAVIAANGPGLETVVVRPRFIWGKGDTSLLPEIVLAAKSGQLLWIGGAKELTSTCHVRNVCEGIVCAWERGTPGAIYFLTDGAPIAYRELLSALLRTQGIEPPTRTVLRPVAHAMSIATDLLWRVLRKRTRPPLPHATFHLLADEMTVSDARARREIGYVGAITREQGLREMTAPAP